MKMLFFTMALITVLLHLICPISAYAEADISAKSAIVVSGDTGEVIYEKNADERMLIASTTKVMTALVAIENIALGESVKISPESVAIEGSSMYLKPGESYTVEELLYGMLLVSGNDAAHALAMHIGGSVEGFAELMNKKAEALGLQNSAFENPHGLDAPRHYSTARDLAAIMREAMKSAFFRRITKARSVTIDGNTYYNHNRLLKECEGVNGGKTGYTIASGRSLISSCERGGTSFIIVTLADPDDWADHKALYDWAYGAYEYKNVAPAGEYCRLKVISGSCEDVGIAPSRSLSVFLPRGAEVGIRVELPSFAFAAIRAGEAVGVMIISGDGGELGRVPLCYTQDVPVGPGISLTFWERVYRARNIANRYGYYGYGFYPM